MSVIKNLAYIDKNRLKTLKSFEEAELSLSAFLFFPFDFLHSFLPYRCKFLGESFVLIQDKKINGLISINKTSFKKIKITRLFLEENSKVDGKLLVDYVTTLYSSKGVESFFMIVNKKETSLLTMLKDGCGFKTRGKEKIYKIEKDDFHLGRETMSFDFIKKLKYKDLDTVCKLNNDSMNSYQKVHFQKCKKDIAMPFFSPIEQFIIENSKGIISHFSILELNKSKYMLDLVIEPSYEGYLEDIIKFTKTRLLKNRDFQTLFVKLRNYYSNFENLKETLDMEYKDSYENEILIKDFMITSKQSYSYERMIFNDITPAF